MIDSSFQPPNGWQTLPLKRLTRFAYGESLATEYRREGTTPVYGSNGAVGVHNKPNTRSPCIVIGRKGSYGKIQYSSNPIFAIDTTFFVDASQTQNNIRFLYFLFSVSGLDSLSDDTAIPGLSREKAYQSLVPFPPIETQKRIVAFLDEKTARIDALIAKKKELLDRLAEKRQALITQAVTKGLNPDAPMKDSGIDWLGQIPAHWEVVPLKRRILSIQQGWSPSADERIASLDEWGVLKSGCVNEGVFDENSHKALPSNLEPKPELEVEHGNILMCRASGSLRYIGSVALVEKVRPKLMFSDKTYRIKLLADASDDRFFVYSMASKHIRDQIILSVSGAEGLANNISQSSVGRYLHSFPPLDEQRQISAFIQSKLKQIDDLFARVDSSRERLQEYRLALITAAVTGQIEGLQ